MNRMLSLLVACLLAVATPAFAHEQKIGDLILHHAWSRATPNGAKTGAVYVVIENTGDVADQLLSVATDVAAMAHVHQMSMNGDVMKMSAVDALDLPPHAKVELKPQGLHIMLMGLKKKFAEGDTFPVTLTFAKAGTVTLQVVVDKADAMDSMD